MIGIVPLALATDVRFYVRAPLPAPRLDAPVVSVTWTGDVPPAFPAALRAVLTGLGYGEVGPARLALVVEAGSSAGIDVRAGDDCGGLTAPYVVPTVARWFEGAEPPSEVCHATVTYDAGAPAPRRLADVIDATIGLTERVAGTEESGIVGDGNTPPPLVRVALAPGGAGALVVRAGAGAWVTPGHTEAVIAVDEPRDWRALAVADRGWSIAGEPEAGLVLAEGRADTGQDLLLVRRMDALERAGLVRVDPLLRGGRVAMRYATPDNFTGIRLYPPDAGCYLAPAAADALLAAHAWLVREGMGLLVYDCYRPLSVQRRMFEAVPDPRYVAPPPGGGRHNRAAAVDVGLVDAAGNPVEMPTAHDAFEARAGAYATAGVSPLAIHDRGILQAAMTAAGFTINRGEWWHFDGPAPGRTLDLPFPTE